MSRSLSTDTLPGFLAAGPGVYYFDPSWGLDKASAALNISSDHPRVIMIFGWMNARAAHLYKYVEHYRSLFPNAVIVVVRSWPSFFWASTRSREQYLTPMIHILKEKEIFASGAQSILIHTFSNGGAYLMTELSRIISQQSLGKDQTSIKHAACLVFDSCPGPRNGGIWRGVRAFVAPIRSHIARLLASLFFLLALLALMVVRVSSGQGHLIERVRSRMNNVLVFPWTTRSTPRLYIYSDADEMIPMDAIEDHIAEAKRQGLNVHAELFHGSSHVSLSRKDPERYWGAVQSSWSEAVKLFNGDK